ncbi:MAG TPA: AI-2E family transporter [Candidatus Angelobacter sp.]|nr:AI-2E family transporter [Candidatus Angelobacter sp.]
MSPGKPELVGSQPEKLPPSPTQAGVDPASRAGPWMDERKRSYATLLLLTAGAFYMAYIIYRPFLKALFLALVLTIAFMPVHEWVTRRVRGNTVAALITTTIVLLVIMLPLMFISIRLVSEAVSLYSYLSQQGGAAWANRSEFLNDAVQRAAEQTGMSPVQIKSTLTTRAQEFGSWLVSMAGWAARGFAQQVTTGILTLLLLFFFLRDREKYSRTIVSTFPLPPGRLQELSGALHDTVVSNLYGMVAVGLIQGSLTALGWWMVGLPAPFLWGAMATIFSFIPLLGPSLVWIPGAFVLAIQGKWIQAAVLVAWGAIVVSAADYIVRPRFAGRRANVNTLLVLLSLLGGLKAFGAIGIIAGPVVLSALVALLKIVREERQIATGVNTQSG